VDYLYNDEIKVYPNENVTIKPKSDCQITITTIEITSFGRLFPKLSLKDRLGLDIPAQDKDPSTTEIIVTNNTEDFIELTMSTALGIFQSFNNIPLILAI